MKLSGTLKTYLIFFLWYEYKMGKKEFLKFDDVEMENWVFHSSIKMQSLYAM